MSAWLCGNKTLSLCVDVLKEEKGYSEDCQVLLEELSELNTRSLDCRYGKSVQHILSDKEYVCLDVDDGQKYKSVCCYLYQTCECDANYDDSLFKSLEDYVNENEDEFEAVYDVYEWDIDRVK